MNTALWFSKPIRDDELNATAAAILYALSPVTNLDPVSYAANFFGGTDVISYRPASTGCPPVLIVTNGDYKLVFVGGAVKAFGQVSLVTDEWDAGNPYGYLFDRPTGISKAVLNAAQTALVADGSILLGQTQKYYRFFGHSFGGEIAHAMHYVMLAVSPWGYQHGSVSMGAPKSGNQDYAAYMNGKEVVRWMLDGDPVPALPPRPGDAPAVVILYYGFAFINRLGRWVHLNGGVLCNPTTLGTFEQEQVLLGANAVYQRIANDWLGGVDEQWGLHSMNAYRAFFTARATAALASTPAPGPLPRPRTETLRSREVTDAQDQGRAVIVADIASPNSVLRDYVITPIPPTSTDRYQARREGSIWFVERQGKTVDVGPGKRHAKQIARRLNRAAKVNH